MIDYRNAEGHACCCVRKCGYRMARIAARELNGEIVGHSVMSIPAGDDGEEFSC